MRYAVPLFKIISGFLLYYSDLYKDRLNYMPFLKKRLNKVLIPYILWTIIYNLYYSRHSINSVFERESLLNLGKYSVRIGSFVLCGNNATVICSLSFYKSWISQGI